MNNHLLRGIETSDGSQFACVSISANGRFTLAWRDSDGKGLGGARSTGKGQYWLFEEAREVCKGRLERPNGGSVANDGTFGLEDWLFTSDLASIFYVFAPDGRTLVRKRLKANIGTSMVTDDGQYAVCSTAYSPGSGHSHSLFLFHLPSGALLWQERPPFSPHAYSFDIEQRRMTILPGPGQEHHHYISCTLRIPPARDDA